MEKEVLSNGYVRMVGNITDTRTGDVYNEVICKSNNARYYKAL